MAKDNKPTKYKDEAGLIAINNFILWSYTNSKNMSDVEKPKWLGAKFQYIGFLAQSDMTGEIPTPTTLMHVRQRRLATALHIPYSTFRERLNMLKENGLVGIDEKNDRRICLLAPDQNEIDKALKVKIGLVKSKHNKQINTLGFTLVPNSLLYGYPEVLPAAKFVFVLIKSLDWTGIGATWHRKRKLAKIAGIKYRTFKKYLQDLVAANLLCITKKFGFHKKTHAIHYQPTSQKEQSRAISLKKLLKNLSLPLKLLVEHNSSFDLCWSSLNN